MKLIFTALLLLSLNTTFAQSKLCTTCNKEVMEKAQEMIQKYKDQGYQVFKGGYLELENKTFQPMFWQLLKQSVYHVIVVGQPDLAQLNYTLSHESFGSSSEIRESLRAGRDNAWYSEFSYVPQFTGNYIFSIMSKVPKKKKFCVAIYLLYLPRDKEHGGEN